MQHPCDAELQTVIDAHLGQHIERSAGAGLRFRTGLPVDCAQTFLPARMGIEDFGAKLRPTQTNGLTAHDARTAVIDQSLCKLLLLILAKGVKRPLDEREQLPIANQRCIDVQIVQVFAQVADCKAMLRFKAAPKALTFEHVAESLIELDLNDGVHYQSSLNRLASKIWLQQPHFMRLLAHVFGAVFDFARSADMKLEAASCPSDVANGNGSLSHGAALLIDG